MSGFSPPGRLASQLCSRVLLPLGLLLSLAASLLEPSRQPCRSPDSQGFLIPVTSACHPLHGSASHSLSSVPRGHCRPSHDKEAHSAGLSRWVLAGEVLHVISACTEMLKRWGQKGRLLLKGCD
ncbi:hypothetical protein J1605_004828 [Eschrichtius robustus]|uniref:Uncharacterized protein n=1 Tax=Eschrichtius robustus TaxID=9764 RepID=A0AB34HGI3_ESCRO|nr:hypothetical protein J1605_004828 [Eschrichtius robustus]